MIVETRIPKVKTESSEDFDLSMDVIPGVLSNPNLIGNPAHLFRFFQYPKSEVRHSYDGLNHAIEIFADENGVKKWEFLYSFNSKTFDYNLALDPKTVDAISVTYDGNGNGFTCMAIIGAGAMSIPGDQVLPLYIRAVANKISEIGQIVTNGIWLNGTLVMTTVVTIVSYVDVQQEIKITDPVPLYAWGIAALGLAMEVK